MDLLTATITEQIANTLEQAGHHPAIRGRKDSEMPGFLLIAEANHMKVIHFEGVGVPSPVCALYATAYRDLLVNAGFEARFDDSIGATIIVANNSPAKCEWCGKAIVGRKLMWTLGSGERVPMHSDCTIAEVRSAHRSR